ncbi:MAG: acyl-CoA dehydrogenase family protein [Planctomycetes bacterium]|nr:acyl-CoA dehydrogenase family protein [Planctomycetota bacterium]
MSTIQTDQEKQSFAETAMRLGGKSEEEARRLGAVDKADEQVETLFAARFQTSNSPIHKAIWDGKVPLELFAPPPLPASAPCDAAMERSLDVIRRRRSEKKLLNQDGKLSNETLGELAQAGYWGMLIDPRYGGQGAPFARFSRFLTRMGTLDSMTSAMASVHGCIGAVDPLRTFGTPEQKSRLLPLLASGERLSAFALTEPWAGSDLTALRTTATLVGDHYEVTGEKLFITNVVPGRLVGLVVLIEGKPAVLISELPEENEHFQLVKYGLYALKEAYNQGLKFHKFRVPSENLLKPKTGDGLTIAYHGLNLGRLSLCAGAAAAMRVFLANMLPWSAFRKTYGQPIQTRELVKRRIARLAALIAGTDALVAWGSWLIDEGYRGELECIIAKIFGSEAEKEAAIELFMKTHGGRSFLRGHLFGDNVHEFLAPCIYEGEGEMLGMAFFKSIVKEHGRQFFEPIGKALQQHQIKNFSPANPIHLWKLRRELGFYSKWSLGQKFVGRDRDSVPGMDPRLKSHLAFAQEQCQRQPKELSGAMIKHQLKLADRQCRMSELSQRAQDIITIIVTALWGHQQKSGVSNAAADVLCQDLRRKLTGERPSDKYFREVAELADLIIAGGFEDLAGIPVEDILMGYESQPQERV